MSCVKRDVTKDSIIVFVYCKLAFNTKDTTRVKYYRFCNTLNNKVVEYSSFIEISYAY